MFEEDQKNKYATSPFDSTSDIYLSAKEIQEKRGEDLARRLHRFRMSLRDAYSSSPVHTSLFDDESIEKAFLYEFSHLNDIGKKKFASLIWVKNVEEEISALWPEFSRAVNDSLSKI